MAPKAQNKPASADKNRAERKAELRINQLAMKNAQAFLDRSGIPANAEVQFTTPSKLDTLKASNAKAEQLHRTYRWNFYDTLTNTYEGDGANAIFAKIEKEMYMPKNVTLGVPEVLQKDPESFRQECEQAAKNRTAMPWEAPPKASLSTVIRGINQYQYLHRKGPKVRAFDWPLCAGLLDSKGRPEIEVEKVLSIEESFPLHRDANCSFGMMHSVYSVLQMGSAESVDSEGGVERQIGHRLEGYYDIPNCVRKSQSQYICPTAITCFGADRCQPDMFSLVIPPTPNAWSLYKPIALIGEAKKETQNVSPQMAVGLHPTLVLLVASLMTNTSWDPLKEPDIPEWMYIYGIAYSKESVSVVAFFPSYKIKEAGTGKPSVEWYFNAMTVADSTMMARYNQVFSKFDYFKRYDLLGHLLVIKNHAITFAKKLRGEEEPNEPFVEGGMKIPDELMKLAEVWNQIEEDVVEKLKKQKEGKAE